MDAPPEKYDAVVFDLLTALLDSWSLWNQAAGSEADGLRWRRQYLELTYRAGTYRPYETIVREAAVQSGIPEACADALIRRWPELQPWPEVPEVLSKLGQRVPLAIVTNCSESLGHVAASRAGGVFKAVITAESVGFYKPRPEPYRAALSALGAQPSRTLFVAGSAADVPGAKGEGMTVFWHNRINLKQVDEVQPDHSAASLQPLLELV